MTRRHGLNPPFRRQDLDNIARAEVVALALLHGHRHFRRRNDPPGTHRIADPARAGISATYGLTVAVIGYVNGVEDPGLNCHDCPLCDLEPAEAQ